MKGKYFIILLIIVVVGLYYFSDQLKGPSSREMPDLTGLTVEAALKKLESFTPGEKKILPEGADGVVEGQEPAPGDVWVYGEEIVLHVSDKEPLPEEIIVELEQLSDELRSRIEQTPSAHRKVIVVSGTLVDDRKNVNFSQLELLVIEKLREYLAKAGIQIAEISREDWIVLRLPKLGEPPITQKDAEVLVLKVNINPSESIQKLWIRIQGYTFLEEQRENTDIWASIDLDYSPGSPARRLYEEPPDFLPIPKGTKKNPYQDIDDVARILAAEAVDSYPSGKSAAVHVAPSGAVPPKLITLLKDALRHNVDDYMKIVAGYDDFRRLVERLNFEKRQQEFNQAFSRADIYILVDVMDFSPEDFTFRISMRAFWLTQGTMVKGLKAIAYARYGHFGVKAELNKNVFKTGDKANIEVQPVGRSCFVWIFNVMADGTISLLFPYSENDDNFIPYGETLRVPGDGYELILYTEHDRAKEEIRVVAVKYEVDFPEIDTESSRGHVVSLREYKRWLYSIPENDREVSHLEYTVER